MATMKVKLSIKNLDEFNKLLDEIKEKFEEINNFELEIGKVIEEEQE